MAASSYNHCLLFCIGLAISSAFLCHGEPVLDSDGNEVGLASTGLTYRIQRVGVGFHGGLVRQPINLCQDYIAEGPETFPGKPISFEAASGSDGTAMESGRLYTYSFFRSGPILAICTEVDVWVWPLDSGDGGTFSPLVVGQFPENEPIKTWFSVASAGGKGVYKLFACPCMGCALQCPTVGFSVVNGTTVLGVGGEPFTFQFVKVQAALAMKTDEE